MTPKPWYTSKTLWVNFLAFVTLLIQTMTGYAIPPEYQVGALAGANFILRLITKQPIG